MRAPLLTLVTLALLTLLTGPADAALPEADILALGTQFVPQVFSVSVGQTITWATPVVTHSVSTTDSVVNGAQWQGNDRRNNDGDPDTFHETLAPAKPVTHAFSQPGTYTYFCNNHRAMLGTIVVE